MMQRIYIDTSVVGGLFDAEFSADTRLFFDKVESGSIKVVYSEITDDELADAPDKVRGYLKRLTSNLKERVEITPEAVNLADMYIRERVVGRTSRADCMHIALATIHKVDILISWNFKHIVNINRIKGYNSVNLRLGHKALEIRTPKEI
jgi:hypothetical protein